MTSPQMYYHAVAIEARKLCSKGVSKLDAIDTAFGLVPDPPNGDEPSYREVTYVSHLMREYSTYR